MNCSLSADHRGVGSPAWGALLAEGRSLKRFYCSVYKLISSKGSEFCRHAESQNLLRVRRSKFQFCNRRNIHTWDVDESSNVKFCTCVKVCLFSWLKKNKLFENSISIMLLKIETFFWTIHDSIVKTLYFPKLCIVHAQTRSVLCKFVLYFLFCRKSLQAITSLYLLQHAISLV